MDTTINTQRVSSWNEADRLISILRLWGIDYLVGEHAPIDREREKHPQFAADGAGVISRRRVITTGNGG